MCCGGKGEQLAPNHARQFVPEHACRCPGCGAGSDGRSAEAGAACMKLPTKIRVRDGVCQLSCLERDGGHREAVAHVVLFLMRGLTLVGRGAKGPVGSHTMQAQASPLPGLAGGCCWMFLPSKETPEPGQALLLVQREKTGSGEKQFVPF